MAWNKTSSKPNHEPIPYVLWHFGIKSKSQPLALTFVKVLPLALDYSISFLPHFLAVHNVGPIQSSNSHGTPQHRWPRLQSPKSCLSNIYARVPHTNVISYSIIYVLALFYCSQSSTMGNVLLVRCLLLTLANCTFIF